MPEKLVLYLQCEGLTLLGFLLNLLGKSDQK